MNRCFGIGGRIDEAVFGRVEILRSQLRGKIVEIAVPSGNGNSMRGGNEMWAGDGSLFNGIFQSNIDESFAAQDSCGHDSGIDSVGHRFRGANRSERKGRIFSARTGPDVNVSVDQSGNAGVFREIFALR